MGVVVGLDQSQKDFHVPSAVGVSKITPESFLQRAYETFCYGRFLVEILCMNMIDAMLLQSGLKGTVEKLALFISICSFENLPISGITRLKASVMSKLDLLFK